MTFKVSDAVRNAMMAGFETAIGAAPVLKLRTGAPPANLAAVASGTVLASMTLPADWLTAPAGGAVAKSGTWQDSAADADGTVGHFEICAADGVTRHAQGTVTATGGGGDMTLDNVVLAVGQAVSISTFSLTDQNG